MYTFHMFVVSYNNVDLRSGGLHCLDAETEQDILAPLSQFPWIVSIHLSRPLLLIASSKKKNICPLSWQEKATYLQVWNEWKALNMI